MKDQLKKSLTEAMKSRDKIRLETIRGLITAIQYEEIEKKVESLSPENCLAVLQRESKKRKEELDFAEKANRPELIEKLKVEIAVIAGFLPSQLSADQLEKILLELKEQVPGINLGAAMKNLKEKYSGQYDSKLASELAKRILG